MGFNGPLVPQEEFERGLVASNCLEEVPRVERPSAEQFARDYVVPNRPVIITGVMPRWPTFDLWRPGHLRSFLGNRPIGGFTSTEGRVVIDTGEAMTRLEEGAPELYITNLSILDSPHAPSSVNHRSSLTKAPELAPLLTIPEFISPALVLQGNAWMGTGGVTTNLHFDDDHNLFCLYSGKKEGVLFAPSESSKVYPLTFRDALSGTDHYEVMSHVNVSRPQWDALPLYREARYRHFTLEPGEILFIPSAYWHYLRSYGKSIGVNYWFQGRQSFQARWRIFYSKNCYALPRDVLKFMRERLGRSTPKS
jgi:hypothetical protein